MSIAYRDNVTQFVEKPELVCPSCPLGRPYRASWQPLDAVKEPLARLEVTRPEHADEENIACIVNAYQRSKKGLPKLPCSLIESAYGVDVERIEADTSRLARRVSLVYVTIMPPGGIDQILAHEQSKGLGHRVVEVSPDMIDYTAIRDTELTLE
jgi:hypothetical protein